MYISTVGAIIIAIYVYHLYSKCKRLEIELNDMIQKMQKVVDEYEAHVCKEIDYKELEILKKSIISLEERRRALLSQFPIKPCKYVRWQGVEDYCVVDPQYTNQTLCMKIVLPEIERCIIRNKIPGGAFLCSVCAAYYPEPEESDS